MGGTISAHRPPSKTRHMSMTSAALLVASSVALSWVPPGGRVARPAIPFGSAAQDQLAAVASSLRRERAVLNQKKQQLQRTAAVLQQQKEEIEEDLSNQVIHFKKAKIKAEESLRREREELQKEKMRLAKESEALSARQQQLMEAADELSSSGRQENQELIESVNKEKAKVALARERQQLKRQAEAIQVARQQLVKSMDRGQELEDLRTKAEALEAEADALRRERAALETQRRRIQAEAEDIAEEREILEQEAKKIHRAVSSDNRAAQDKDLLESLRAAERQLAQQTAEFRNFKWRVESESKAAEQRALAKAAKPLLLVLDDVQRAQMAGAAKGLSPEDLKQVLKPLRSRLLGVLETEFSVHPMPNAVGKAFDPQLHEAISLRDDQVGPDVVVEQLEEGFLFGDSSQVLRPAKVIVSS